MVNTELNLEIEDERWQDGISDIEQTAEKMQKAVFGYVAEHTDLAILTAEKTFAVNVCLSNDERVWQLNKEFRGKDKPTNVLSFANIDFADFTKEFEQNDEVELGDIILAYETMVRESETEGITLYAHFCHLLVHGFLHILGYDHIEEDEAEEMENLEVAILAEVGVANPYAEREL